MHLLVVRDGYRSVVFGAGELLPPPQLTSWSAGERRENSREFEAGLPTNVMLSDHSNRNTQEKHFNFNFVLGLDLGFV